jgi:hypothetical protein
MQNSENAAAGPGTRPPINAFPEFHTAQAGRKTRKNRSGSPGERGQPSPIFPRFPASGRAGRRNHAPLGCVDTRPHPRCAPAGSADRKAGWHRWPASAFAPPQRGPKPSRGGSSPGAVLHPAPPASHPRGQRQRRCVRLVRCVRRRQRSPTGSAGRRTGIPVPSRKERRQRQPLRVRQLGIPRGPASAQVALVRASQPRRHRSAQRHTPQAAVPQENRSRGRSQEHRLAQPGTRGRLRRATPTRSAIAPRQLTRPSAHSVGVAPRCAAPLPRLGQENPSAAPPRPPRTVSFRNASVPSGTPDSP